MTVIEKACAFCGRSPIPRRNTYCGHGCVNKAAAARANPNAAASRKRAQRFSPLGPCERCGATGRTQRHHEDLSKPIDIQILCMSCHVVAHQANGSRRRVGPALCQVCGQDFQPKQSRRSRICSDQSCKAEMGRRSAAKRWGGA